MPATRKREYITTPYPTREDIIAKSNLPRKRLEEIFAAADRIHEMSLTPEGRKLMKRLAAKGARLLKRRAPVSRKKRTGKK